MGTDIDFIVYNEHDLEAFLTKEGYSRSTLKEYLYCEKFNFLTVRKGRVNLIVSTSKEFVDRFIVATHICREYNVKDKIYRIAIHHILRGENDMFSCLKFPNGELKSLLNNFMSPHCYALCKIYEIKHGIVGVE